MLTVCNSAIPLSVVFVLMTHRSLVYKHLHTCEVVIHINQWCVTWQLIELKMCDYWRQQEVCTECKKKLLYNQTHLSACFQESIQASIIVTWRFLICIYSFGILQQLFAKKTNCLLNLKNLIHIQRRHKDWKNRDSTARRPISPHNQNNVPSAWIERDISETSICYLKEEGGRSNTSKISPA